MSKAGYRWDRPADDENAESDAIDAAFGEYIKAHRNLLELTKAQVAEAAGMQKYRYDTLERGDVAFSARKSECEAIARVLKLHLHEVLAKAAGV